MKIIKVSSHNDREAWLDFRRGVVMGTKAKGIAPPKRGNSIPAGIYELVAEKVAIAKDGEKEMDRGLRLEEEGLKLTAKKFKLDLEIDPGMWMSDDGKLGVSPDAAERSDKPMYAAENKSLDSKNHLQGILNDVANKKLPLYNPLDSLKIGKEDYAAQAIQYFVVNKDLQTLYFGLYDDRIALDNIVHYVIIITRGNVEEYVDGQELYERDALKRVDEMIKTLKGIQ